MSHNQIFIKWLALLKNNYNISQSAALKKAGLSVNRIANAKRNVTKLTVSDLEKLGGAWYDELKEIAEGDGISLQKTKPQAVSIAAAYAQQRQKNEELTSQLREMIKQNGQLTDVNSKMLTRLLELEKIKDNLQDKINNL